MQAWASGGADCWQAHKIPAAVKTDRTAGTSFFMVCLFKNDSPKWSGSACPQTGLIVSRRTGTEDIQRLLKKDWCDLA